MSETLKETKLLAEQGDADAQYRLGYMYFFGDGVPENKAKAAKWYRLAAEQGEVFSQARLDSHERRLMRERAMNK